MASRRRFRVRQGLLRAGPVPGPALHRDHPARGARHGRAGDLRRHHRPAQRPHRYPGTAPGQAGPAATSRTRNDLADRPGDQASARRPHHLAPAPAACHSLGHVDPPPPGPLTMVPQTRKTHPLCRNRPGQLTSAVVQQPRLRRQRCARLISFFGEDLIAQIDALVADIHAGTGDEPCDLLLALPAKRAGEISSASFAAALLSGADVTVESFLNGGGAHAEVAEHTPGPRTRIKRQRGEQVLGAHLAAPGPLGNRGRTLHRSDGLSRHQRRPPAGPASSSFSSSWEELSRGGADRVGPHPQLLQHGGRHSLVEKPDQLVMGTHLGGPVSGGLPLGRLHAAPGRCAQPPGLRCAPPRVPKALPGRLLGYPYPLADLGPGTPRPARLLHELADQLVGARGQLLADRQSRLDPVERRARRLLAHRIRQLRDANRPHIDKVTLSWWSVKLSLSPLTQGPLAPNLAALPGFWPSSQLTARNAAAVLSSRSRVRIALG